MALMLSGRMHRFWESVRRYSTLHTPALVSAQSLTSPLPSHRPVQQRLNRPLHAAFKQRHGVKLPIQQQRISVIYSCKRRGHKQFSGPITDFEMEISKPDDDIDLPKAAALLALHAGAKTDTVDRVMKEMSRLKTGFQAHATANVPLAAPLPKSVRQPALAGALRDYLKAEGFEGCSLANYYQAENSMLHSVLAHKRGNAISLGLLYCEVGLAGGLCLKGVNFPRHHLLQFGTARSTGLLDPFSNRVLRQKEVDKLIGMRVDPVVKAPLAKAVFLKHMALNLQNVYQRDENTELAARLAPYVDVLGEKHNLACVQKFNFFQPS